MQCTVKGYTFSFFFQHGDAPNVGCMYDHLELSDTAKHVCWLIEWLPNVWTCVYIDNLYNSQKLFSALYLAKCLGHARPTECGIPDKFKQQIELNPKKTKALKGKTIAVWFIHLKDCPDLLTVCV